MQVEINAAASSTLARQIEAGAPADLFLSADVQWMDRLEKLGALAPGTRRDLLRNELVIATPKTDGLPPGAERDLPAAVKRCVALADPEHVPAGRYAKQVLQARGWWDALQGRMVPAADVRAALALLVRSECEAGFVYATDIVAAPSVRRLGAAPEHDPIVYPVAAVKGRVTPAVKAFLDYIASDAAQAAARARGFQ
jgi:molybdate transport system substrate-binding protein